MYFRKIRYIIYMNIYTTIKNILLTLFFAFAAISLQGAELHEDGSRDLIQLARDGKYEELKESVITSYYYLLFEDDLYGRISAALTEFDGKSNDEQSDLWSKFTDEVDDWIKIGKERDLDAVGKFLALASAARGKITVMDLPRVIFVPEIHNLADCHVSKFVYLYFLLSRTNLSKVQILTEGCKYGQRSSIGLFSFIILDYLESTKAGIRNQEYDPKIHCRNRGLLAQHLIDDRGISVVEGPDGGICAVKNFHDERIIQVNETGWDLPGLGHTREAMLERNQSLANAIKECCHKAELLIIPCGKSHSPICDFEEANDYRNSRQEAPFGSFVEFYAHLKEGILGTTKPIYDMLIQLNLSFK